MIGKGEQYGLKRAGLNDGPVTQTLDELTCSENGSAAVPTKVN